ncbi:MAG: hypothetical protein NVSMB47_14660 [Polyangiales bacterium]
MLGGLVAADATTLGGCAWPDFVALAGDAAVAETTPDFGVVETSSDVVVDTTPSDTPASYTLPDGRVCTGHDEDGDGIPDQCDNCPNVANPAQGPKDVGDLCAASPGFITPPSTRLIFDPLMTLSNWSSFGTPATGGGGVFAVDKDGDSLLGGTTVDFDFRFIVGKTGAGLSATVATTLLAVREDDSGSAGILLRVSSDPKHFIVCAVSTGANGFAAAHAPDAGCTGGPCNPIAFPLTLADGGVAAAQLPIPTDLPHKLGDVIGLRASIVKNDTAGAFECRVFDPKNPGTLQSADPKYAVRVDVPSSRWLAGGEVGLYSQKAKTQFLSIDVLRGP